MIPADDTPVQQPPDRRSASGEMPWFGKLDQRDFDAEFYERLLDRQPNDIRLLRLLGELYARKGRHDQALAIDHRLVELVPDDCIVHYNLACSLAMRGAAHEAIEALGEALRLGYNDFAHLEVDPELNSLRQLPQYRALLARYGLDG